MAEPSVDRFVAHGARDLDQATPAAARDRISPAPARWGLAAIYALLAYEWLLSGLDKALSPSFRSGLAATLRASLQSNPNGWFVSLMERFVIPQARVFAYVVETGELLVAAGFLVGAALWVWGERFSPPARRWLGLVVVGALIGSAFMTANYDLLAGHALPWLDPDDPFDEGLSIDGLMTLIALALIPVQIAAMRVRAARER